VLNLNFEGLDDWEEGARWFWLPVVRTVGEEKL